MIDPDGTFTTCRTSRAGFDAMLADVDEYRIGERLVTREEFLSRAQGLVELLDGKHICEVIDPRGSFLVGWSGGKWSQFGEDNLVRALLGRIGVKNLFCFEVGASDGICNSNTKTLRDDSWGALLIEADDTLFGRLAEHACLADGCFGAVTCVRDRIGPNDLDRHLARAGAPKDLDFGSIDIDGQDYHVFDGLKLHRPRALLVEYNNLRDDPPPPVGGPGQAGLTAILALGRTKGYVPLVRTNVNVLFATEETLFSF